MTEHDECASCGSNEDLGDAIETGVPFCDDCWEHGHLSEQAEPWDDIGGGD